MWQEEKGSLLRLEIDKLLAPIEGTGNLLRAIKDSLQQVQKEAMPNNGGRPSWDLLPFIVCEAICGRGERAISASAAISVLRAALEVFDDIEDEDNTASISAKYGTAVATNVATALLFVAETALTRLKIQGVPDEITVKVVDKLNAYHLSACVGQHYDISFPVETFLPESDFMKIIEMKGASQVECACHIGALLGNGTGELVDLFSKFGRCLGIAAQIANDIHGITHGRDIENRKVTLPLIYAMSQAKDDIREQITNFFRKPGYANTSPENVRDLLFKSGAMQYTTIKMEIYRQEARAALSQAEGMGACVVRLEPFVA